MTFIFFSSLSGGLKRSALSEAWIILIVLHWCKTPTTFIFTVRSVEVLTVPAKDSIQGPNSLLEANKRRHSRSSCRSRELKSDRVFACASMLVVSILNLFKRILILPYGIKYIYSFLKLIYQGLKDRIIRKMFVFRCRTCCSRGRLIKPWNTEICHCPVRRASLGLKNLGVGSNETFIASPSNGLSWLFDIL